MRRLRLLGSRQAVLGIPEDTSELAPVEFHFNPIELAWAFVKKVIRREGPRDDESRQR